MEHLTKFQIKKAIREMERVARKYVLFSITSDNYNDKSHISLHPLEWWMKYIERYSSLKLYKIGLSEKSRWLSKKMCQVYRKQAKMLR